ncbi:alkyl hydroperoxide reductase subunit AhpC [Paraburkholderia youngii]
MQPEFEKRNVKAIALSVDDVASHKAWTKDIEETQKTVVGFPIIAGKDNKVAADAGVGGARQAFGPGFRNEECCDPMGSTTGEHNHVPSTENR